LDQRSQDLFTAHSKAQDVVETIGADDAAAILDERRRTILLEIEEKVLNYFQLKANAATAEQALRAYRDKHRSSMMARASAAWH
jgi:uncharacterized protein YhaN